MHAWAVAISLDAPLAGRYRVVRDRQRTDFLSRFVDRFEEILPQKRAFCLADMASEHPYGWFGIYGQTDFPDWCYGKNSQSAMTASSLSITLAIIIHTCRQAKCGYIVYYLFVCLFVCSFVCTVTDFSDEDKASGVKFLHGG